MRVYSRDAPDRDGIAGFATNFVHVPTHPPSFRRTTGDTDDHRPFSYRAMEIVLTALYRSRLWSSVLSVVMLTLVGHDEGGFAVRLRQHLQPFLMTSLWSSCWHPPNLALPVCLAEGLFPAPADALHGGDDAVLFCPSEPRRFDMQCFFGDLTDRDLGVRLQV
jgi:hypothetical protein